MAKVHPHNKFPDSQCFILGERYAPADRPKSQPVTREPSDLASCSCWMPPFPIIFFSGLVNAAIRVGCLLSQTFSSLAWSTQQFVPSAFTCALPRDSSSSLLPSSARPPAAQTSPPCSVALRFSPKKPSQLVDFGCSSAVKLSGCNSLPSTLMVAASRCAIALAVELAAQGSTNNGHMSTMNGCSKMFHPL